MREDGMRDQLENAAQEAERHGRLPSAADVMRRGDRRRTRATATRAVAAALIVVAGGGGWWLAQDGPDRGTPAPPATADRRHCANGSAAAPDRIHMNPVSSSSAVAASPRISNRRSVVMGHPFIAACRSGGYQAGKAQRKAP